MFSQFYSFHVLFTLPCKLLLCVSPIPNRRASRECLMLLLSVFGVLLSIDMSFLTQQTDKCWSSLEAAGRSVLPLAPRWNTSGTSVCQWAKSPQKYHGFMPEEKRGSWEGKSWRNTVSLVIMVINSGQLEFSLGTAWLCWCLAFRGHFVCWPNLLIAGFGAEIRAVQFLDVRRRYLENTLCHCLIWGFRFAVIIKSI